MIYFILTKPLPTYEEQPYGPAWWDMKFVNVNGYPIPFKSRKDALDYMKAWNMSDPKYTIWKLNNVSSR